MWARSNQVVTYTQLGIYRGNLLLHTMCKEEQNRWVSILQSVIATFRYLLKHKPGEHKPFVFLQQFTFLEGFNQDEQNKTIANKPSLFLTSTSSLHVVKLQQ